MFRANLFKAKLAENDMNIKRLSDILGINEATLYRKMTGTSDFTRNEIQTIKLVLRLSIDDVENIFFAKGLA